MQTKIAFFHIFYPFKRTSQKAEEHFQKALQLFKNALHLLLHK